MTYLLAQSSDIHLGGPVPGAGERFSWAIDTLNAMSRQPDLVLLTGDVTHDGADERWEELQYQPQPSVSTRSPAAESCRMWCRSDQRRSVR